MAYRDPRTAVVAALTAPPRFTPEPEPVWAADDRAPRATVMRLGPFARDPATVTVLKRRERGDRQLYAMTFVDLNGNDWFWLAAAERSAGGWVAHGVAGGSDGPACPKPVAPRPASAGSGPWLNLCGQWGGHTFYAGGRLDPAGAEIGRVCLTLDDASQLEDDGTGDVSLFIGHHGVPPRRVEIYAPNGALLSSRKAF